MILLHYVIRSQRFEWPVNHGSSSSNAPLKETLGNQSQANSLDFGGHSQLGYQPVIQFSPRIGHLHAGCAKDIKITFKSSDSKFMRKEMLNCVLSKISFDQPISEVKDWDDRITLIKWVNEVVQTSHQQTNGMASSLNDKQSELMNSSINLPGTVNNSVNGVIAVPAKQIVKRKVVEVEPEPRYTKSDETVLPLELYVSVNCDYSKYRCKTNAIRFKDTLMFQTRVFE